MIYFWIALLTLIISSADYSVHMDEFLYMQKQKKIAKEQAVLEHMITSSKYLKKIRSENDTCLNNFNLCKELLNKYLTENNYMVNNKIEHCMYLGKITTYYKSNDEFYGFILDLYKEFEVKNLKDIHSSYQSNCNTSYKGVYIQQDL